MPLIDLRAVTKHYTLGEVQIEALAGVDFTLDPGELTAVWGPSGSGKTTLCNLVGLLDAPTSGSVLLEGRDVAGLSDDDRADFRSRRLGFIFQGFNLIPVLSALENVALPLAIQGIGRAEARARAEAELSRLGLPRHLGHRPDRLSGGQRQRVAVARAMVTRPALVVADEPTANLDSETALDLVERLRRLNAETGVTFLIATHDPRILDRVRRRVLLRDGRIAEDVREPETAGARGG